MSDLTNFYSLLPKDKQKPPTGYKNHMIDKNWLNHPFYYITIIYKKMKKMGISFLIKSVLEVFQYFHPLKLLLD